MAIGDDAAAAGFALVPDTGVGGEVRNGARELNRTRDYIAQVKNLILAVWPVNKGGTGATTASEARTNLGICGEITYGTSMPSGGSNGDIYFKYVP
jgi:hypothetical protein